MSDSSKRIFSENVQGHAPDPENEPRNEVPATNPPQEPDTQRGAGCGAPSCSCPSDQRGLDRALDSVESISRSSISEDVLMFVDYITPIVSSLCGMPQYDDATMDELLQALQGWSPESHQMSDELLRRVSGDLIKTNLYTGP